jgi:hypothetical protein
MTSLAASRINRRSRAVKPGASPTRRLDPKTVAQGTTFEKPQQADRHDMVIVNGAVTPRPAATPAHASIVRAWLPPLTATN